ncbi:MAG: sigma-70 family RNA polymerase sigma factor [Planctomycetes bacterium]|nr:sigma-70 family RNA polymerase sigma factor [Planctomycetota bacterium]
MHTQRVASDAFVRYRDRGDVAALAAVFDLVAQQLLLVASHLTDQKHDAEELLQETFVLAIHNAHAYDETRPVEPWLVGILGNVARNARRRAGRGPRLGDRVDAAAATLGPDEAAAAAEFTAAVHSVLPQLSPRQREVITLHLVHGMTPTEIAHAIGSPVGTVKSWLFRGVRQLRSLLPAGFALAIAAFARAGHFASERALSELREQLLARATAMLQQHGPVLAVPAAASRRLWYWFAVAPLAAVVAGSAWLLDSGRRDVAPPPTAAVEAASPPVESGSVPTEPAASSRAAVAGGDGATLHVTTSAPHIGGYAEPVLACDPWLRRRVFRTDEDGRAELEGLLPGRWRCVCDRGPAAVVELGNVDVAVRLAIPRGVRAVGVVVDANAAPVGGSAIWLSASEDPGDGSIVGETDRDGRFDIPNLPVGRWLSALHPGFRAAALRPVPAATAPEGTPPAPIRLVLDQPAATVEFAVFGDAGGPLSGATVQLGRPLTGFDIDVGAADECRARPPWVGTTDADGRVRCPFAPVGERLWVCARAPDHPALESSLVATDANGVTALTLRLPPSGQCRGRVAFHGAENPAALLASGRIVVRSHAPETLSPRIAAPIWAEARVRAADDGTFELTGVATGDVLVRAELGSDSESTATTSKWFAETVLRIAARGETPWFPQLGGGGQVRGTARDGRGAALAGYRIAATPPVGRTLRGTVAADGSFVLSELADVDYEVSLAEPSAPDRALLRRTEVRAGAALDLVLAEPPSGFLSGRLDVGAPMSGLVFDVAEVATGQEYGARCDVDGRFRVGPLPRGRYHWFAGTDVYWRAGLIEVGSTAIDLGALELQPPLQVPVWRAPGELPSTGAIERAFLWTKDALTLASLCQLDATGSGLLFAPPGSYLLSTVCDGVTLSQQAVELSAQVPSIELVAPANGEHVELVTAPAPPSGVPLHWHLQGGGLDWRMTSRTAPGRRAVSSRRDVRLPPGNYVCTCSTREGASGEVRFTVTSESIASALSAPRRLTIRLQ